MGTYDTIGGTPRHDPAFDNFDNEMCDLCKKDLAECQCPEAVKPIREVKMKVTIMPKDVGRAIELDNVVCYFFDYETLHVRFENGLWREYPARHIWYAEGDKK